MVVLFQVVIALACGLIDLIHFFFIGFLILLELAICRS